MLFQRLLLFILVIFFNFKAYAGPIKVIFYSDGGNPPYAMSENGHAYGLYIDIVNEVVKELPEYHVEIVPIPWSRGLTLLSTGDIFALIGPYKIEERKFVEYSVPIFQEQVVAYCRDDLQINKPVFPKTFYNFTNGINSGFLLSDDFTKLRKDEKFRLVDGNSSEINVKRLLYKRIDCFFNDKLSTLYAKKLVVKSEPNLKNIKIKDVLTLSKQSAYIGYTKNLGKFSYRDDFIKKFNESLEKFSKTKKFTELLNKYSN